MQRRLVEYIFAWSRTTILLKAKKKKKCIYICKPLTTPLILTIRYKTCNTSPTESFSKWDGLAGFWWITNAIFVHRTHTEAVGHPFLQVERSKPRSFDHHVQAGQMPAISAGYGLQGSSDHQIIIDFQYQTAFILHYAKCKKEISLKRCQTGTKSFPSFNFFMLVRSLESFFIPFVQVFGLMHALAHICHLMFHVNYIKIKIPIPHSLFHIIQTKLDESHSFSCSWCIRSFYYRAFSIKVQ